MAQCEVCGNNYDKSFEVTAAGKKHVFDSFECAIHALAPQCRHCGTRIIGHGVEDKGGIFCCVHCARVDGSTPLKDIA
jgi:nitrite reductase/ring-hydroxylating ferredoxin subunit